MSVSRSKSILARSADSGAKYEDAARLFEELTTSDEYTEFLTLPAYEMITLRDAHGAQKSGDTEAREAFA